MLDNIKSGARGQWTCQSIWYVNAYSDGRCSFEYVCCDYEDCANNEYERFENVQGLSEYLIDDSYTDFMWVKVS